MKEEKEDGDRDVLKFVHNSTSLILILNTINRIFPEDSIILNLHSAVFKNLIHHFHSEILIINRSCLSDLFITEVD